jgi:hypothetical protein
MSVFRAKQGDQKYVEDAKSLFRLIAQLQSESSQHIGRLNGSLNKGDYANAQHEVALRRAQSALTEVQEQIKEMRRWMKADEDIVMEESSGSADAAAKGNGM